MSKKPDLSVVILTFNGEKYIGDLLKSIYAQKTKYTYEVIVIDSGSGDRTIDIVNKFPVRLYKIKNKDFGHGKTRNHAITLAKGEFVVFIVQDAVPTNEKWLDNLIKPFGRKPSAVAVYGKHLPRKDAPPFIQKDIIEFFNSLSSSNKLIRQKLRRKKKYTDLEWGKLVFFSDVNCALRKKYVEKNPYKDISYAEDQIMGQEIIKKGYIKIYNPRATVFHSHNYPIFYYLFRYFDEYCGLKEALGYQDNVTFQNIWINSIKGWLQDTKYIFFSDNSYYFKIKWTFYSAIYNFLRRLGAILAKNADDLPLIIHNFLSLEYRNKHKTNKKAKHRYNTQPKNDFFLFKNYITNKLKKMSYVYKRYGLKGVLKLIHGFFVNIFLPKSDVIFRENIDYLYTYISKTDLKTESSLSRKLFILSSRTATHVINWIVPDFGIGSGGHMGIFRFINYLENKGIKNNIYMFGSLRYDNAAIIKDTICKYFIPLKAKVYIGIEYMDDSDILFSTSWHTAYAAFRRKNTKHKYYFVQDFEPFFYPMSSEYIFAENTYRMGFTGLTAGSWLSNKLGKEYGMKTYPYNFFPDDIFVSKKVNLKKKNKIFFYVRPPTPRRGYDLGTMALDIFHNVYPDVEIHFAGWEVDKNKIKFPFIDHGILQYSKLPAFYKSCDVGLVISLTNCSLIPIDLMACGCVVVSTRGDNNDWLIKHRKTGLLAETNPRSIADILVDVFKNAELRTNIIKNAHQYSMSYSCQREYDKLFKILKKDLT